MQIPINKEHGSWAVFIFSCVAGVTTGLLTQPWLADREFSVLTLLTIAGLTLLINSKKPISSAIRTTGESKRKHIIWITLFSMTGFVLLIPFLLKGLNTFIIFSPLIVSYVYLLFIGKEHSVLAEINGFALLAISAPIVHFVITDEMSLRLYFAVFMFFTAGVFKVRAKVKKTVAYRLLMVIYCVATPAVYQLIIKVPAIVLLPFAENIISVLWLRDESLRTTGNLELIKGIIFSVLLGFFW